MFLTDKEIDNLELVENYIVLDIETTGLSPVDNDIIEIAAIEIKNGSIVNKFDTLINPGYCIPSFITGLTGITNQMVCTAPFINDVIPNLVDFVGDLPIIAHNASFDMRFISSNCKKCGFCINNEVIDTLKVSRQLYPDFSSHKLDVIANNLGVNVENAHRAMADVEVLNDIFNIMLNDIKCGKGKTTVNIEAICRFEMKELN